MGHVVPGGLVIARVWRGATLAEHGDEYAAYVERAGLRNARDIPGARGTLVLRRERSGYAEFETILLFETMEDVKGFAGDELDAAVFFEEDDRYLVERELEVRHYEVDVHMV
jgi:antibiotic biosynthesis monooxygenase (ABM) superfamily enzyme